MRNLVFILLFLLSNLYAYAQDSTLVSNVLIQLNLSSLNIKYELIVSKTNPSNSKETILVIPEILVETDDYFDVKNYILIVNTVTGKIINKYTEQLSSDAIRLSKITIDTALYIISDNKRAFGIRISYNNSSQPNPYGYEAISLFVTQHDSLTKVLNNFKVMEYSGESDAFCALKLQEDKKILIVTSHKINNFYTILIKNKFTEKIYYLNKEGSCVSYISSTKTTKQELKFNNTEYK